MSSNIVDLKFPRTLTLQLSGTAFFRAQADARKRGITLEQELSETLEFIYNPKVLGGTPCQVTVEGEPSERPLASLERSQPSDQR